jgi:hypothetical protein
MKARSHFIYGLLLFLFTLYVPLTAAAAQWSKTAAAPNVYSEDTENSSFFSQGGLNNTDTISSGNSVSWDIGQYSNGATRQIITLHYTPPISSSPTISITIYDAPPTSGRLTGNSSAFNGQPAKGQFKLTYRLVGGTYPVYPSFSNTLTVGY